MKRIISAFACLLFIVSVATAEETEELLVTSIRNEKTVIPGASLKRPADYILQRIKVSNDSLEEKVRTEQILETLRLLSNAAKEKNIELALLADYRTVVPMKLDVAALKMTRGSRSDTSELIVCLKIKVIPGASNAATLFARLKEFAKTFKPAGRSGIDQFGDIELTIANPGQYRGPVIKLYAADSKLVTSSLGSEGGMEYRVVTKGIDRQLQWMRDGLIDVVIYIPYEYDVIPTNVASYVRTGT